MGPRGRGGAKYENDRACFLRDHLDHLESLASPSIHGYTIVHNDCGVAAERFLDSLPKQIAGVPLTLMRRPNKGMSYAAFAHAVGRLPSASHFVLMEDDYVPTRPDFARWMVEHMPRGMLTAAAWDWRWHAREPGRIHAAIFGGVVYGPAIRAVLDRGYLGKSVLHPSPGYDAGYYSQVTMSWAFATNGYDLADWLDEYASAYWTGHSVEWYAHGHNRPALIVPLQAIGKPITMNLRYSRPLASGQGMPPLPPARTIVGVLNLDGTVTEQVEP